ncbi:MAG TPA: CD225/dispanin family protein [Candidatus Sulfotelmatobacter sp.]|nr:CD225/dispanin family protein [Candidatus Sulfotelmatobacter sp.]
MYCPQCGASNADTAAVCVQCGRNLQAAVPAPPIQTPGVVLPPGTNIQNYLVFAILTTVLCCLPAGIPAIVYAAQVNGKLQAGDIAGAKAASDNAKMWCWISFGLGLGVFVIWMIVAMVGLIGNLHRH